jgi:hypothetical protein
MRIGIVCTLTAGANRTAGAWESPEANNWPLVAVHAALTPDGRVLTFGSNSGGKATGFFIYDVWDPAAGLAGGHVTLDNLTGTDIFCGTAVTLPAPTKPTGLTITKVQGNPATAGSRCFLDHANVSLIAFSSANLAQCTRWQQGQERPPAEPNSVLEVKHGNATLLDLNNGACASACDAGAHESAEMRLVADDGNARTPLRA